MWTTALQNHSTFMRNHFVVALQAHSCVVFTDLMMSLLTGLCPLMTSCSLYLLSTLLFMLVSSGSCQWESFCPRGFFCFCKLNDVSTVDVNLLVGFSVQFACSSCDLLGFLWLDSTVQRHAQLVNWWFLISCRCESVCVVVCVFVLALWWTNLSRVYPESAVLVSDRIKRVKLTDEWTDDVSNEKSYVYSYYLTNIMSTLITAEEVTDVEMKLFQVTIVP